MNAAAPLIYKKISLIMGELEAVGKNQTNTVQRFKFRGVDDVTNAVSKLMAKHGVFAVPTVLEERAEERQSKGGGVLIYRILKIRYDFFAEDGSSVPATVIGEGMDSGDKAANKAMSVGYKYALVQVFCIATEDTPDPDRESHEVKGKTADDELYNDSEAHRQTARIYFENEDIISNEVRRKISRNFINKPLRDIPTLIKKAKAEMHG